MSVPEDELPVVAEPEIGEGPQDDVYEPDPAPVHADSYGNAVQDNPQLVAEPDEDEGLKPIPDRLISELSAHRTLALRHSLGERPEVAFLAALHVLCLRIFYAYSLDSCLEIDVKHVAFNAQAPGLSDTAIAQKMGLRHAEWAGTMPIDPAELWNALDSADSDTRSRLFAYCVSVCVNGVFEAYNRRPRALAHADRLAQAVDLDMAAAGWTPTIDNYLGRVTKARILGAVREAKGEHAAQSIDHLKKYEMAEQAQALLAGAGWLPEPLRTPGRAIQQVIQPADSEPETMTDPAVVQTDSAGQESAMGENDTPAEVEPVEPDTFAAAAE